MIVDHEAQPHETRIINAGIEIRAFARLDAGVLVSQIFGFDDVVGCFAPNNIIKTTEITNYWKGR